MGKCAGCHADLPGDAAFCPQCGRRMVVQEAAPVVAVGVGTISDIQTITGDGPTAAASLADGEVFHGRYAIERQLGAGAMGVVYAAKDQVTGRTVALKLINPALAEKPAARERFLREGLMARDIRHANIVAMYDVGEVNGQVYLVMEYLAGDTLRKWLHRTLQEGNDIAFDAARRIIRIVLEGLAAAHATGVVHRDLKPENIMLTADPSQGDFSLKILDFGIARTVGTSSHVTTTSSSTGTPLYMAPEQKTAADTVGPAADLYAVTAILYELLIGVAPEGRWQAPSRERKDLPPGIDAVIEKGLSNRPRSRYQSAAEYIHALDDLAGAPVPGPVPPPRPVPPPGPSPPPDPAAPWWKARSPIWAVWGRLSKKQRIVAGVLALLVVFGIIGAYDQPGPSPRPEPPNGGGDRPVQVANMTIAGRWSDEQRGAGVAQGYVDFLQQGNVITGAVYNLAGYQVGTLTGQVQGTQLEYAYVAVTGQTGTARANLAADGNHLLLTAQDNATGQTSQHVLHRNHMPPQ